MSILFVEQPWTAMSLLLRPRYQVDVFDEHDVPIAVVRERSGPGLQRPLRYTGFSGWTTFDLDVVAPDGRPLIHIDKGFGKRPKVKVSTPDGRPIGAIKWLGGNRYAVLDANDVQLCLLGDIAHVQVGALAKRNGKRVRRDTVKIRPDVTEPLRTLAMAGSIAFDVVRGKGTSHVGDGLDLDWI